MTDLPVHVDVERSLKCFELGEHELSIHGIRCWKLAVDLDRYQRVIAATKPEVVVETGSKWGGSARWFEAHGLDVVTIDIDLEPSKLSRAICVRTEWIKGSSISPDVVEVVAKLVAGRRVMVSLDAEHAAPHVAAEIQAYGPLVSQGCYLVVEDSIFDLAEDDEVKAVGGLDIPKLGGPLKAIEQELAGNPDWERDEEIEKLYPTSFYPAGWWRRV
ncbi:MAG TPA: CmcI family methyltransferase [Jiangellaceae bacterium]|nr:CmcI family methyltransferase [Jiangellaceae bacterium]